jgi:hypothetical protein
MENLGFDEDYTLTFTFFPEVKVHILYTNFEEEEDEPFTGAELKFLFSGERVRWIPTEDLIGLIEATLGLFEILIRDSTERHELSSEKTGLLIKAIEQRRTPFVHLKSENLEEMASFIGGKLTESDSTWQISKSFFRGFDITLKYALQTKELDLNYTGAKVTKINNYARDQLGIFVINHCLRYISVTYPEIRMPKIVGQMFSYSYLRAKNVL